MKSKEKLLQLRHDFYDGNGPLDYDSIAYFTTIEKDLDRLEKYDKAKKLIKKKKVDVADILYISKMFVKELWIRAYNRHHPIYCRELTQKEFDFILEVFK